MDRLIALLVLIKLALFASVASYALTAPVEGPGIHQTQDDEPRPEPVGDALVDADLL